MHLVGVLCADRASAAGGWATIYRRGTSTPATTYTAFDGSGASAPERHDLDGYGVAVRYVNELVDVSVYNSSGVKVLGPVTDGANATAIEIIHPHVTGTDYTTAAGGLGKPSTHQRDLDARYTSFGADDSKVLVGGVQRNLKDVLLTGFVDVKGPTYGALGNGVADDTTPVQAAITAADAAGGGIVLLPPGTYPVSSLTIPSNVTLLGAGAGKTILQTSSASEVLLVATGSFTAYGIKFKTTDKGILRFTATVNEPTVFTACAFEFPGTGTANALDGTAAGSSNPHHYSGCTFTQTGAASARAIFKDLATVNGGTITFAGGILSTGSYNSFSGVTITYTGAATKALFQDSDGPQSMVGCALETTGGGTLTFGGGGGNIEWGNHDIGATVSYTGRMTLAGLRESSSLAVSTSATSYSPNFLRRRAYMVASSGASFEWGVPADAETNYDGLSVELWYKNTSGGAITPTLHATWYKGTAVSVASGSACGWLFRWSTAVSRWVQIGSPVAYAA